MSSFTLTSDKKFPAIPKGTAVRTIDADYLLRLCPSSDLVAYVTPLNQVAVHRMNWQKLKSMEPESKSPPPPPPSQQQQQQQSSPATITDLCWHPCGKSIHTLASCFDINELERTQRSSARCWSDEWRAYSVQRRENRCDGVSTRLLGGRHHQCHVDAANHR